MPTMPLHEDVLPGLPGCFWQCIAAEGRGGAVVVPKMHSLSPSLCGLRRGLNTVPAPFVTQDSPTSSSRARGPGTVLSLAE